jgi:hypothetical protein
MTRLKLTEADAFPLDPEDGDGPPARYARGRRGGHLPDAGHQVARSGRSSVELASAFSDRQWCAVGLDTPSKSSDTPTPIGYCLFDGRPIAPRGAKLPS